MLEMSTTEYAEHTENEVFKKTHRQKVFCLTKLFTEEIKWECLTQ